MDELLKGREQEKAKLTAAIDEFTEQMKARAFQKVDEGYTGWDTWDGWSAVSPVGRLHEDVSELLGSPHISRAAYSRKLVDAANFAVFAWWLRAHNS